MSKGFFTEFVHRSPNLQPDAGLARSATPTTYTSRLSGHVHEENPPQMRLRVTTKCVSAGISHPVKTAEISNRTNLWKNLDGQGNTSPAFGGLSDSLTYCITARSGSSPARVSQSMHGPSVWTVCLRFPGDRIYVLSICHSEPLMIMGHRYDRPCTCDIPKA
nr:hypothetical protein CFP56_11041 [Quercus suber]